MIGVTFLLARSAVSLGAQGWHGTAAAGLVPVEWVALTVIVILFVWGEGWRALARRWAPFVVGRIHAIDRRSPIPVLLLAPLWAVGLVAFQRKLLLRSWGGVAAIVLAVVLVQRLPDPWRGMIDLGVASALVVGVVALLWRAHSAPA